MRLLHVVPTYLPATRYGGPIYSVHGLAAGLARRGHEVHVYTTNVDGPGVSDVPIGCPVERDGVSITYFPTSIGRRIYRSPLMGRALRSTLRFFDLAHLHSVFLWPTMAAAAEARRAGVPYVLSPRGMLVPELIRRKSRAAKRAWIALFERRNVAAADAVHVTADIEATNIGRLGLQTRRLAVIANGVDVPACPVTTPAPFLAHIPKPMVLYLGRINWKKGLDRLIPAMAYLEGVHLTVAGNDEEGYTPHLETLARAHGVFARTHFLGPLHGDAKWQALATADVFVLTSYSENFGIAVLEAMAAGVPVVVTPEVGLSRAVADAGAGLVVEGEPHKIAASIASLLSDGERRRRMGEAGRKTAADHYSWAAIAERMEALYADITGAVVRAPAYHG